MRDAELLAILNAGPSLIDSIAFMSRQQRKRAEHGIDALIDYLDALELDADLEEDGCAEPYMSRCETGPGAQPCFEVPGLDECEPDADSEPSLGATCFHSIWQDLWSRSDRRDLEDECEDEGSQCEDEGACIQSQPHDPEPDEHSLGSLNHILDQERWAEGEGWWFNSERELDDSDDEYGDERQPRRAFA